MGSKKPTKFRQIGWNGVQIEVPDFWEIDGIRKNYLLLENDGEPVLEVKWNLTKVKTTPRKILKKINKNFVKNRRNQNISLWQLPQKWKNALSSFDVQGFEWRGDPFKGKGVILYCSECKRSTVVQFYERNEKSPEFPMEIDRSKILASFKDHSVERTRLWSVFDMHIPLPENFRLIRHSFKAGAFEIHFDAGAFEASFYRWSPASVILSDASLKDFAQKTFSFPETSFVLKSPDDSPNQVEFQSVSTYSFQKRLLYKFLKKPLFKWARAWQKPEANRILGVKAQGPGTFNVDAIRAICEQFEIV